MCNTGPPYFRRRYKSVPSYTKWNQLQSYQRGRFEAFEYQKGWALCDVEAGWGERGKLRCKVYFGTLGTIP